jgi:hypothetical protein
MSVDPKSAVPGRPPLNPYLVMLIAIVAPGSGQWAAGNVQRGVVFVWFMMIFGWIGWHLAGPQIDPVGRLAGGIFIYAISIMDAYRMARFRWARYHAGRAS